MKTRAFTLIEVLIVVLIIGILAAIAVPQYQKAVEKSKAMQALALLRTLYQAADAVELSTGQWPSNTNQLDINIPDLGEDPEWHISLQKNDSQGSAGVRIKRKKGKYKGTNFTIYKRHPYIGTIPTDKILCIEAKINSSPVFSGEQGSYCSKIFAGKATYVGERNWEDVWVLP